MEVGTNCVRRTGVSPKVGFKILDGLTQSQGLSSLDLNLELLAPCLLGLIITYVMGKDKVFTAR